jgi:hypothetical protein
MAGSRLRKAPRFKSVQEFQEFWDTHNVTDFKTREAHFDVDLRQSRNVVSVEPDIMTKVQAAARSKGVGAQTLINLWLAERVAGSQS